MKNIIITLVCLSFGLSSNAQNDAGTVTFERRTYWINIMSRLPYITQEDIDRDKLTWGKNQGRPQEYVLHFKDNKSVYTAVEKESDGGYSWRQDKYMIIRDHKEKRSKDWVDLLGKTYIIEDEVPKYKWKILNEIKEVAGYLCMKAETKDTIRDRVVHAWFTNLIPAQAGPEGYDGLPGMILGLNFNDGDVTVEATKVEFISTDLELPIPEKMKGKNITREEFDKKTAKYIRETIEGRKNPFWQLRY